MTDDPALYQALGRVEGKVDALLAHQGRQEDRMDEFDNRLKTLEATKNQGTGAAKMAHVIWLAIAALAGAFADQLKGLLIR